jgi:CheY-like chemotaxis protein
MKKSICYVDDDAAEIERFRRNLGDRYLIGSATTIADAIKDLKEQGISKPDLILLDLYFGPDPKPTKRAEMLAADRQLAEMERKVRALLVECGLSPEGGFTLARDAGRLFPRVPRIFFSRRAFVEDATKANEIGLAVLEKPDPGEGEDYDTVYPRYKEIIAGKLDEIIRRNSFWFRNRQRFEGFAIGLLGVAAKIAWDAWK